MTDWRERLFGSRDRIGWWTVPVFLAVGLAGAVLTGGLAVIYYSNQVDALRDETRSAREESTRAREEIREATDEALETINEQVDAVRQSLTTELPVEDAFAAGVVVVRAFPGPPPQPEPQPEPEPDGRGQQGTDAQSQQANQEDPPPEEPPTEEPPPPPDRGQPRFGSAFPVVRDGGTTFVVTAFEVIESPYAPGQLVQDIELITADTTLRAEVHSFDESLDLALLRVGAELAVPEWRPLEEALGPGDKLWAVGLTPTLNTVQVGGTIALLDPRVVVSDVVILDFLRGGPLVDLDGRVIAVASSAYRPYGGEESEGHAGIPIRALCERLLRCTPEQQGDTPPPEDAG